MQRLPVADLINVPVRVKPRANRSEIAEVVDGRVQIRTTASPVDGKANKQVAEQLAGAFGVPPSRVVLRNGMRSRNKLYQIIRPSIVPGFIADAGGADCAPALTPERTSRRRKGA